MPHERMRDRESRGQANFQASVKERLSLSSRRRHSGLSGAEAAGMPRERMRDRESLSRKKKLNLVEAVRALRGWEQAEASGPESVLLANGRGP